MFVQYSELRNNYYCKYGILQSTNLLNGECGKIKKLCHVIESLAANHGCGLSACAALHKRRNLDERN